VLAIGMGLDPHQVLDTIRDCAGTSWMFENRGPHIADGDYTPLSAVDIFVKDLGIVVEEAARVGLDPAVAARALEQFRAAAAAGWGRDDDSAVARVYARAAGIALPGRAGT
jgi:3-hydroxyisobutyrate dehydrogenase-like beta-hydroxyacid dehydrogenase